MLRQALHISLPWMTPIRSFAINARLQGIERDRETLRAAATLLDEQEATLNRLKACAQNTMQPVCRMPDELLANIFESVTPSLRHSWPLHLSDDKDNRWEILQYNKTLQNVIMTCSRLRSSLLRAPRCWVFVDCVLALGGTTLEALEVMLARSRNCPFYFALVLQSETFPSSSHALQAFSRVLLPHMHRCETLLITSDRRGAEIPLLVPPNQLRALRHVTFHWSNDETVDAAEGQNLDGKAEAVMLSIIGGIELPLISLRVIGSAQVGQRLRGDFGSIKAQALTRLRIEIVCSVREVVKLLRSCSNLEHLYWDVDEDGGENDSEAYPVLLTLNKLISLRIRGGHSNIRGILLTAPQLEQADLVNTNDLLPFDITQPNHPRLPSLTRLSVAVLGTPAARLAPFLHSHPDVTECFIYDESPLSLDPNDVQEHAMHLCAAVESFLAHTEGTIHSKLRHLSIQIGWAYFDLIEDQLTASVQLVLHMLDRVHIDLHIDKPDSVRDDEVLAVLEGKNSSRVSIDPPVERMDLWPQAWLMKEW